MKIRRPRIFLRIQGVGSSESVDLFWSPEARFEREQAAGGGERYRIYGPAVWVVNKNLRTGIPRSADSL